MGTAGALRAGVRPRGLLGAAARTAELVPWGQAGNALSPRGRVGSHRIPLRSLDGAWGGAGNPALAAQRRPAQTARSDRASSGSGPKISGGAGRADRPSAWEPQAQRDASQSIDSRSADQPIQSTLSGGVL